MAILKKERRSIWLLFA